MKTIRNFECTVGALLPVIIAITILGLCALTWEWRRCIPRRRSTSTSPRITITRTVRRLERATVNPSPKSRRRHLHATAWALALALLARVEWIARLARIIP